MASQAEKHGPMTLEEFLKLPDEKPYLEYIDGRIEAKVSPKKQHNAIEHELTASSNQFAKPRRLGVAFPELRCTFCGRSIVPDVVFLLRQHIELNERGRYVEETPYPPDIHVEIISPDRVVKRSREKLIHSTANGAGLGWLIDPYRESIEVFRPGCAPERLPDDGVLEGDPILPGFRLPVAQVFSWLSLDF